MNNAPLGFIGLGNMGGPMSARLAEAGFDLVVYDAAGTLERAPKGARAATSSAEVAASAEIVLLSLPDGGAVREVAGEVAGAEKRVADTVADFSTIGVDAARAVGRRLEDAGIAYIDAPVSGGVASAASGTLTVMAAADVEVFERLRPVLDGVAAESFRVGGRAGQAQAMKLLNNFLSATAMAATSEAVAFGERHGLDIETIISVLNASTGRNTATSDKFPRRIIPGTFDSGFATRLMAKDLRLYCDGVAAVVTRGDVAAAVSGVWQSFARAGPETDFTRIYPFVRDTPVDA